MSNGSSNKPIFLSAGFTLLEILIALIIFSIVAIITSMTLQHIFKTQERLNASAERLNQLQLAITILERSIEQIHPDRFFIGHINSIEYSYHDESNHMRRVTFICRKHQLIKRRQNIEDKILLNNISLCEFTFIKQNLKLYKNWSQTAKQLPIAINLAINATGLGKANFIFILDFDLSSN